MTELAYWLLEAALLVCALRSRRSALMVLAFSLPFSRRLPSLPVPLLNYQNLVLLAALIAYGTDRGGAGATRRGRIHHGLLVAALGALFTLSFINTVTTFVPHAFWRFWDPYENMINYKALMTCFVLYLFASKAVTSREDLIAIFRAGVAGVVAESGYTALEYLLFHPGRVTGHMTEPNSIGSYLACSFTLCLALVLILPRTDLLWKLGAAGTALAPVALLGTLSRGSYVAAGLGFLVLAALVDRRMLLAGAAVIALSPLWLPARVSQRFDQTFNNEQQENWRFRDGKGSEQSPLLAMVNRELDERVAAGDLEIGEARLDSSIQTRLIVWEAAVKMMHDYPFGIGFGVFPWYLQFYSNVVMWKASHNIYLKVGTESGIVTLALFLILVALLLRDAFRIARTKDDLLLKALGFGIFGYLISLSFGALADNLFFQLEVNGQFWLLMGALLQAPLLARAAEHKPGDEAARATSAGPVPLYELLR